MGERLNIEVVKGNKLLANSYYHWSGYSNCAVNLTIEIVESFEYIKNNCGFMRLHEATIIIAPSGYLQAM